MQRLRRLFDLDADPYAVDELLAADPLLAPGVAARPGLRSPGTADPEEFAVRALLGPVAAGELVEEYGKVLDVPCGGLTHVFPEPGVLAGAVSDPGCGPSPPRSPTVPYGWTRAPTGTRPDRRCCGCPASPPPRRR